METTSIATVTFAQAQYDFFWQLVSTNVQYLSIAVAIILGSGILLTVGLYFLNFRPMLKRLSDQEQILKNLSNDLQTENEANKKKFDKLIIAQKESLAMSQKVLESERIANEAKFSILTTQQQQTFDGLNSKIELAEGASKTKIDGLKKEVLTLIMNVETQMHEMQVLSTWTEHYIWETSKIWTNELRSLMKCIELSNSYKVYKWIVPISLTIIDELLSKRSSSDFDKPLLKKLGTILDSNELENKEIVAKIRLLVAKIESE